jgi:hypothetical protein
MKRIILGCAVLTLFAEGIKASDIPAVYNHVDQVLWVVSDVESAMESYQELGFSQIKDLGKVTATLESSGKRQKIRLVCANLGGAHVNWIEPLKGNSVFSDFLEENGDGAMSLVHRFPDDGSMEKEIDRLKNLGIGELERISIQTGNGELRFVLMDTRREGKFNLGFICDDDKTDMFRTLSAENRDGLKLNQYAFAIRDPEPVSTFWHQIGLPEFQINHPVLGETHYYGEIVDHQLIQGWQRHGDIAYEWCIPVKPPIVYEDHIQLHGEGIHHLAFSVEDMDQVLEDFTARGYVVSMGGTWGEKGKPGSGRYEYIDLEKAGGLTMELLWNYRE